MTNDPEKVEQLCNAIHEAIDDVREDVRFTIGEVLSALTMVLVNIALDASPNPTILRREFAAALESCIENRATDAAVEATGAPIQ